MKRTFHSLGFALAALASFTLFGCNQPDKIAAPDNGTPSLTGNGGAHVRLPSLPADYLAKSAAGNQPVALFALTVSGAGMAPMHQSWYLTPGQPQSAYIGGIPVGARVFYGRLMRLDSAFGDTTLTHEGRDTAWIVRDSITDVNLFLRKALGGGTAHVCVEVEGWPTDSTCIKPPFPVPHIPWFGGCWNLSITKSGATARLDSVFNAKLSIRQWDTNLTAYVTWNSGARDSAWGSIRSDGTALIGYGGGSFTFKSFLDTMGVDSTRSLELRGYFSSMMRNISGEAVASRAPCDSVIQPPIDTMPPIDTLVYPPIDTVVVPGIDSSASCWLVWQTLNSGVNYGGTLSLVRSDSVTRGILQWTGFPAVRVTNGDSPSSDSTLYLFGELPKGMSHPPINGVSHVHYKAKFSRLNLESGSVYSTRMPGEFTVGDNIGSWGGKPAPCN